MAENYKLLYEQTKRMLEKYQDEIVPGLRKVIEDLEKERAEVVRCKDCTKISPSVTPIKDAVWCRSFRAYMPCDGFCSYGERREGE